MTPIYENLVIREGTIEAPGRLLRVLWQPPSRQQVVLFDVKDKGALPFWLERATLENQFEQGNFVACENDPSGATIRRDSDLTESERTIRDRRLAYITPLVEDPERAVLHADQRSAVMGDHVARHGGSIKTLYSFVRLWWRGGQLPNALVPAYSASATTRQAPKFGDTKLGRPRVGVKSIGLAGINITPEVATRMATGRKFLDQGLSVKEAWKSMLREHFSNQIIVDGVRINKVKPDNEIPSHDQFIYHVVHKIVRGDVLKATGGDTRFARKNRQRFGSAKDMASGPGSNYQIDATIGDIYLRSHEYPDRLIGRPVIYIVVDVYSHMIVGFCVALSGPSWEVAKLALENAMTEKVSFCASYGVKIADSDWPSHHLCGNLTCDRGTDVTGKNAIAAANGLRYKLVNLPPYRPDWKGLVESRFHLLNEIEVKWAPGASHGRERGEPKHQLDARYTLRDFTELMIHFVLHYNRRFEIRKPPSSYVSTDGRAPTPNVLWSHGCQAAGMPQLADRGRIRANLLHVGQASETDKGLRFAGLHYEPINVEMRHMFIRVRGRTWNGHEIRFDPRDVSTILLPLDRGARFEIFRLTTADNKFLGWTADEVSDFRAAAREGDRLAADGHHLSDSVHEARIADLNQRVLASTTGVRLTPGSAVGIRAERNAVNRGIRGQDAWTSVPPDEPLLPPADIPIEPQVSATIEVPSLPDSRPSRMDALRAAREAARRQMEDDQ